MNLTKEQKDDIQKKLKNIWNLKNCTLCNQSNWSITELIFELKEYNNGNPTVGGSVYPIIPIYCTNCGFTHFINPLVTGIISKPVNGEQK